MSESSKPSASNTDPKIQKPSSNKGISQSQARDNQKQERESIYEDDDDDDGGDDLDTFLKETFYPGQRQEARARDAGLVSSKLLQTIKEDRSYGIPAQQKKEDGVKKEAGGDGDAAKR